MIAAVVVVVAVVGYIYLRGGITSRYLGAVAGTPTHSVESTATPWNGTCPSTEMKFTGIFNECATVDKGMSCPSGSFSQARVFRMHGKLLFCQRNALARRALDFIHPTERAIDMN